MDSRPYQCLCVYLGSPNIVHRLDLCHSGCIVRNHFHRVPLIRERAIGSSQPRCHLIAVSSLSEILSCKEGKTNIADWEGRVAAEVLDSKMSVRVRKIPYLNEDWRN